MLLTCEEYAHEWGYSELYLHAATDNESLLAMYKHWEYEQLPSFDQPEYILALSGREATRFHRLPLPRAPRSLSARAPNSRVCSRVSSSSSATACTFC